MLNPEPALIWVTEITTASRGFCFRETICCTAWTIAVTAKTGSFVAWGIAACPPFPFKVTSNLSAAAITDPLWTATLPSLIPGQLCIPQTLSIGNCWNKPSSIMASPPPPPSSAGWNIKYTVPSKSFFEDNNFAAPSNMAVWPSWPHACIRPSNFDLWEKSFSSVIGKASISALNPIALFPPPLKLALVPFKTPTTPVLAIPLWTSKPKDSSFSATKLDVHSSS